MAPARPMRWTYSQEALVPHQGFFSLSSAPQSQRRWRQNLRLGAYTPYAPK